MNPETPGWLAETGKMKCHFRFTKNFDHNMSITDHENSKYGWRYDPRFNERNPNFCHKLAANCNRLTWTIDI